MCIAEREKALAVVPQRAPGAREVMLDRLEREGVVPRRTGVWVVKIVVRRTSGERGVEVDVPSSMQLVDPLQDDEGGVSFVQVPDGRRDPERRSAARRRCRG